MKSSTPHQGACRCGSVRLEARGEPIVVTTCRCSSCRDAGMILGALPGASPVLNADGGTPFVLYRKDRLRCTQGQEHLAEHRLRVESSTRRIVATCCHTPMFLDFTKGHWLSIYQGRLGLDPTTVAKRSGWLVPRLLSAWVSMGFRAPAVGYVKRRLQAPRLDDALKVEPVS